MGVLRWGGGGNDGDVGKGEEEGMSSGGGAVFALVYLIGVVAVPESIKQRVRHTGPAPRLWMLKFVGVTVTDYAVGVHSVTLRDLPYPPCAARAMRRACWVFTCTVVLVGEAIFTPRWALTGSYRHKQKGIDEMP